MNQLKDDEDENIHVTIDYVYPVLYGSKKSPRELVQKGIVVNKLCFQKNSQPQLKPLTLYNTKTCSYVYMYIKKLIILDSCMHAQLLRIRM